MQFESVFENRRTHLEDPLHPIGGQFTQETNAKSDVGFPHLDGNKRDTSFNENRRLRRFHTTLPTGGQHLFDFVIQGNKFGRSANEVIRELVLATGMPLVFLGKLPLACRASPGHYLKPAPKFAGGSFCLVNGAGRTSGQTSERSSPL